MEKPKLLITASTFPRWEKDKLSSFMLFLTQNLLAYYDVYVLAPHFKGAKTFEVMHGIKVFRFRYCFDNAEILTYGGGAVNNIKKNPLVYFLIPLYLLSSLYYLLKLNLKYKFQIVNVHWILPTGFLAVLIKPLFKYKLIISSHGGDIYGITKNKFLSKLGLNSFNSFVLKNADRIIPVSSSIKSVMASKTNKPDIIDVCPMGVEYSRFYRPVKNFDNKHKINLLFLGRIAPEKGLTYLIEACKILEETNLNFKLTIAGSGPDEEFVKKKIDEYGLKKVEMIGYVNNYDVPELLNNNDIFISTSLREGLPTAYMEAMAAGMVCIVSNTDGIEDLIENNINGLIYNIGDVTSLVNLITKVMANEDLRSNLAIEGQKKAKSFDWKLISKRYHEIYSKA